MKRKPEFQVYFKKRIPNPGICKVLAIDFDKQTATVSNGSVRLVADLKEVHLRESVGVKDLDGNQLYSGDLIQARSAFHSRGQLLTMEISFLNGAFQALNVNDSTEGYCFWELAPYTIKRVGNIYEKGGAPCPT